MLLTRIGTKAVAFDAIRGATTVADKPPQSHSLLDSAL